MADFTAKYYDSLIIKLKSAEYHYNKVNSLHACSIMNDEKVYTAFISEFIATMQTLHTCFDVLAQWLNSNQSIIPEEKRLSLKNVNFNNVVGKIRDPLLKDKLTKLKESSIYLNDFVNTIKHRHIIRVDNEFYFLSASQIVEIIVIDAFEKNGRCYKKVDLLCTLKKIYNEVTTTIEEIIA